MIRLRELRLSLGKSQSALASELCIAQNTLSQWENETRDIDSDRLQKLAQYFKVSTDYLLGLTDDPTPQGAKKAVSSVVEDTAKALENYMLNKLGRKPTKEELSRLNDFAETFIKGLDK